MVETIGSVSHWEIPRDPSSQTNGPEATIGDVIEVAIPRPRDKRAVLHTKAWLETKEHLLGLLTENYSLNGTHATKVSPINSLFANRTISEAA
jgi:hypothetical protein